MTSNEKIWENPDPRIKWALDILDDGPYERTGITQYFWYPGLGGFLGGAANICQNYIGKRPAHLSMHVTIFGAVAGWVAGVWLRDRLSKKNATEIAVLKHYMMLHPEKFPEPEKKKFGDREVFLEWPINR